MEVSGGGGASSSLHVSISPRSTSSVGEASMTQAASLPAATPPPPPHHVLAVPVLPLDPGPDQVLTVAAARAERSGVHRVFPPVPVPQSVALCVKEGLKSKTHLIPTFCSAFQTHLKTIQVVFQWVKFEDSALSIYTQMWFYHQYAK